MKRMVNSTNLSVWKSVSYFGRMEGKIFIGVFTRTYKGNIAAPLGGTIMYYRASSPSGSHPTSNTQNTFSTFYFRRKYVSMLGIKSKQTWTTWFWGEWCYRNVFLTQRISKDFVFVRKHKYHSGKAHHLVEEDYTTSHQCSQLVNLQYSSGCAFHVKRYSS